VRISPTAGEITFHYTGRNILRFSWMYALWIVLGLAAVAALVWLFMWMRAQLHNIPAPRFVRQAAEEPAGGLRAEAAKVQARQPPPARSRKLVPLVSVPDSSSRMKPPGDPRSTVPARGGTRVRPTVTSLRRSLPRPQVQKASLPPLIEMRVGQQNTHVGFRNVHRVSDGSSRSVGGRMSSYLVFLAPVPSKIAELRNEGGTYVFTPLRSELFPGIMESVPDCIGREIPFITPKGREMSLLFREWVSPLEEINRIMRSVRRD